MSLPPFQQLLDRHGHDVHRFLVATVGRQEADDCYQETWLAALRAYPSLRDGSNLRSWILTVAHHKAIDHARRAKPRQLSQETVDELPERPGPSDDGLDPGLWARVGSLPEKQRTALALRFLADAAYEEISTVMGTSAAAARRNVHEGIKRLRLEMST